MRVCPDPHELPLTIVLYSLGMHDIRFFANIPHADILKLIWPKFDIDIFAASNCRDRQVSSVVEYTKSVLMGTLILLAQWQMQA